MGRQWKQNTREDRKGQGDTGGTWEPGTELLTFHSRRAGSLACLLA